MPTYQNYNPYMPVYQNPYQNPGSYQNMGYMQNYQPQPYNQPYSQNMQASHPSLNGKVVQSPNEITPNDVFMDGSTSYFPAKDGSCIYAKCWNQNGSIDTIRYVPETVTSVAKEDPYDAALNKINERLEKIEKVLTE